MSGENTNENLFKQYFKSHIEYKGSTVNDDLAAKEARNFNTSKYKELDDHHDRIVDRVLRYTYGMVLLYVLVYSVCSMQKIIMIQGSKSDSFKLPADQFTDYMKYTFGEIVGIVFVVVNYLFPGNNKKDKSP